MPGEPKMPTSLPKREELELPEQKEGTEKREKMVK